MRIQTYDAQWLYNRIEDLETLFSIEPFCDIFKCRGYIAGGFLRNLIRYGDLSDLTRFFDSAGDIDVFFQCRADYDQFRVLYRENDWSDSMGKNAEQCDLRIRIKDMNTHVIIGDIFENSRVMLQIVNCRFTDPVSQIKSFDFANCKVAFDGSKLYIDDRVIELEEKRILHLDHESFTLGARVEKYFRKHSYKSLSPESKELLLKWIWERYNKQDWRRILLGDKVIPRLMMLGQNIFSDKQLSEFIGKFQHNLISVDYSSLTSPGKHKTGRQHISIDPAEAELNRRTNLEGKIREGDLIGFLVDQNDLQGGILLGRYDNKNQVRHNSWHVLRPDGEIIVVHEYGIKKVLAKFDEVTE